MRSKPVSDIVTLSAALIVASEALDLANRAVQEASEKRRKATEKLHDLLPTLSDDQLTEIAYVVTGKAPVKQQQHEQQEKKQTVAAAVPAASETASKPQKRLEAKDEKKQGVAKGKRTRVRKLLVINKRGDTFLLRDILAAIIKGKPLSLDAITNEFERRNVKIKSKSDRSNKIMIRATLNHFSNMFGKKKNPKDSRKFIYYLTTPRAKHIALVDKGTDEAKQVASATTEASISPPPKVTKKKGNAPSMYTVLEKIREKFADKEFSLRELGEALGVEGKIISVPVQGLTKRNQVQIVGTKLSGPNNNKVNVYRHVNQP